MHQSTHRIAGHRSLCCHGADVRHHLDRGPGHGQHRRGRGCVPGIGRAYAVRLRRWLIHDYVLDGGRTGCGTYALSTADKTVASERVSRLGNHESRHTTYRSCWRRYRRTCQSAFI